MQIESFNVGAQPPEPDVVRYVPGLMDSDYPMISPFDVIRNRKRSRREKREAKKLERQGTNVPQYQAAYSPFQRITLDESIQFPHCDSAVLHAPGHCEYCDDHPEWQTLRVAWRIPFTDDRSNGWGGNVAVNREFGTIINEEPDAVET